MNWVHECEQVQLNFKVKCVSLSTNVCFIYVFYGQNHVLRIFVNLLFMIYENINTAKTSTNSLTLGICHFHLKILYTYRWNCFSCNFLWSVGPLFKIIVEYFLNQNYSIHWYHVKILNVRYWIKIYLWPTFLSIKLKSVTNKWIYTSKLNENVNLSQQPYRASKFD